MKRMATIALYLALLVTALPLAVSAEGDCDINGHDFADATCTEAKKCIICGLEEGDPLGHNWQEATCYKPKTCKRCKITEGERNGHEMLPADCTRPKRCKNCAYDVGKPAGHKMGDFVCGKPYKCVNCDYVERSTVEHCYAEDWDDTCGRCGHVRDVDYDYIIEVGEELVIKQGGKRPLEYRVSDSSVLERTAQKDCSSPAENDTDYKYCTKGTFVGRKAGAVQICGAFGLSVERSWLVKVVKSDKPATKSTTKTTTAKPTTTATEKPTESTTQPTTEAAESTTEPTTIPTSETTEPTTAPTTAAVAEPMPKKLGVWPYVAGGGAVLLIAAGAVLFILKKKK